MYTTISSVYDYIFPQNPMQLSFIESVKAIDKNETIIEIGAATGNLTDLLMSQSKEVIGLDLDEGLLKEAKRKYPDYSFIHKNMLDLHQLKMSFDRIVCFGNTLVHLPNRKLVQTFFNTVYDTLKIDGYFIVQIINYNRILNQAIDHLPTIDNEHVNFKRNYVLHDGYLDFNTELIIKSTQEKLFNSIQLLTLTQDEIEHYLSLAGFKNIKFYGDLKGSPVSESSIPLLFSCTK